MWPVELPVAGAVRSKRMGRRAVDVEDLDAMVAGVGDGDHEIAGNGDAPRLPQIAGGG